MEHITKEQLQLPLRNKYPNGIKTYIQIYIYIAQKPQQTKATYILSK